MDFWCRLWLGSCSQSSSFSSSSSSSSSGNVRRTSTIPRTRRTTRRANNWRRAIPKFEFSSSRRRDGGGCKNAWIHSVQRQRELNVTSQLSRRCHRPPQRTRFVWSWQMQLSELLIRAFKDQKCPQWPNVLGLTLCVRRKIQTQPKNTSSSLLCPNLEKPRGSSKNCHNPVSFTRKKNRSDLDCHHLETWTRGVSHEKQIFMRETGSNPPVDFLSSKRGSGSSYNVASLRMIATPWQISNL